MNTILLYKHGFTRINILNVFYYNSEEYPKNLYHVIKSKGIYFFRGMGKTIALIKDEQHLIELKKKYNLN